MQALFTVLFLAGLVGCIAVIALAYTKSKKAGGKSLSQQKPKLVVSGALAAVFMVLLIFIPAGFHTVRTGEVAVVRVWGEAKQVKQPGLFFINIVSSDVITYDLKTQQMNIDNEVYTKDAQLMSIQMTVQFKVMGEKVLNIARDFGSLETLATRIERVAIEKAKVVLSAKTAMELIETRGVLSADMFASIKDIESQYYISIENVMLVDMAFSAAFENAVEQKMVAQQDVIRAEAEKEKAIIKAQQDLEVARLDAQKALAAATGRADAERAVAKGAADAIKAKTIEVARMLGCTIVETKGTEWRQVYVMEWVENEDEDAEEDGEWVAVTEPVYDPVTGKVEMQPKTVWEEVECLTVTIDTSTAGDPIRVNELIKEYLQVIAYLEKWDGVLPLYVGGDGMNIFVPAP
ncbi:MAG: prohibitin family protein [Firmicutes bacterium]|nr:prohibitin family protein [Bacillota bacterium]